MLNTQPNVITIIVYSHSGIYTQIQFYIDSLNLIILEVTPPPPQPPLNFRMIVVLFYNKLEFYKKWNVDYNCKECQVHESNSYPFSTNYTMVICSFLMSMCRGIIYICKGHYSWIVNFLQAVGM